MILSVFKRKIHLCPIWMLKGTRDNKVTFFLIMTIPRLADKFRLMTIVSISNRIRFCMFSSEEFFFFSVIFFNSTKSLNMRWREFREECYIRFNNVYLNIHFSFMINTIFEDQHMRIARIGNRPERLKKHDEPFYRMISSASYTENSKGKTPFTIIISFRRPDITTSSFEYFCDNMTCRRLSK